MSPQEKIIIAVAEVQGFLDYWSNACANGDISNPELETDLYKMNNILNDVLSYVHQTYERKTTDNSK